MSYVIKRDMGSGSFGKVLIAARSAEPPRRVAIKASLSMDVRGLRAEYWRVRSLAHPHIIAAIEFMSGARLDVMPRAVRQYKAAFVMEAATMSLSAWLGLHGPCSDAGLASAWSSELASALAHVHGQGVVHRDVKPGNCLCASALQIQANQAAT